MSKTARRRLALQVARSLPAARCPICKVALERVVHPAIHMNRCADRLEAEMKEAVA